MKIHEARAASHKEWDKVQKFPAWDETEVPSQPEVIRQPKKTRTKHTTRRSWMCVIGKIQQWTINFKTYKGRVVLGGVTVRDDCVDYAVFTEEGASASHMTEERLLDKISRLPRCSGHAVVKVHKHR